MPYFMLEAIIKNENFPFFPAPLKNYINLLLAPQLKNTLVVKNIRNQSLNKVK